MATNETVVNGSHIPHSIQALQDEASQLKDTIKLERMKYADTTRMFVVNVLYYNSTIVFNNEYWL